MKHACLVILCALLISSCTKPADVQKMSAESQVKEQIIEVSKRLYARELFSGAGGDISVRVPGQNRFIVKATGQSVGFLDDTKLSTVTFDKEVVGGNPSPSAEPEIHAAIYSMRSDVGAILHLHSPFA